jgi:hypothetical protein
MEYRKETNGWQTLLSQFQLTPVVFLFLLTVYTFFETLTGTPWIYFFVAATVLLFSGAGLIVSAKIPLYQSGRFFTFGVKSIPLKLKRYYRWGWRIFLFGVALSLCLLLSEQ